MLIPCSCLGYDINSMRNISLAEGESISGQVFTDHKAILTANPEQVLATAGSLSANNHRLYHQATGGRSIESNICAPLILPDQSPIGTITLSSTHSRFSDDDLTLLEAVAGRIS